MARALRPDRYVLDGKAAVAEPGLLIWAAWMETGDRRVALTELDGCHVSTVFLGGDRNFSETGPPLLFETMVFMGPCNGATVRYCTWEEAERGHAAVVAQVEREIERVKGQSPA